MTAEKPVQKPKPASARPATAASKPVSGIYDLLIIAGGLAACAAIVAFIAPEWSSIPPYIKLAGHAALNGAVAFALFHYATSNLKRTAFLDALTVLLAALTLTFIVLVFQTYKLQYPLWQWALLWMILATPFWLTLSQGRRIASGLWVISAVTTYFMFIVSTRFRFFADVFDPKHTLTQAHALVVTLVPFGFIALGENEALRKYGDKAFTRITLAGFLIIAIGVSLAQTLWGQSLTNIRLALGLSREAFREITLYTASAVFVAPLVIAWARQFKILVPRHQAVDAFLVVSALAFALPFFVPHGWSEYTGVSLLIAYWIFCAWTARKAGYAKAYEIGAALILLRLMVVYVEICGSFIRTGAGLIISSIALMALVYGTNRAVAILGKRDVKP